MIRECTELRLNRECTELRLNRECMCVNTEYTVGVTGECAKSPHQPNPPPAEQGVFRGRG